MVFCSEGLFWWLKCLGFPYCFSQVNPQFYAFRWITLLLTQEFDFADSLRLWDSLLANPEGPLVSTEAKNFVKCIKFYQTSAIPSYDLKIPVRISYY